MDALPEQDLRGEGSARVATSARGLNRPPGGWRPWWRWLVAWWWVLWRWMRHHQCWGLLGPGAGVGTPRGGSWAEAGHRWLDGVGLYDGAVGGGVVDRAWRLVWGVPGRRRAMLLGVATVSLAAQALLLSHVASQGAAGHQSHHHHHPHAVLRSWQQQQQQIGGGGSRGEKVKGGDQSLSSVVEVVGEEDPTRGDWGELPRMLADEWTMAHHLSVTLLFELTKLAISSFMLLCSLRNVGSLPPPGSGISGGGGPVGGLVASGRRASRLEWRWEESRHFLVPAFLYLINDNLLFAILSLIDPATFEVLGNMRILTTSLFYRLVFRQRHHMNQVQWASLILLCIGTATSQLVTCGEEIISAVPISGFLLALLYCFVSGFAGVYLEYLMKRRTEQLNSFHFQSVQLYAYGVILNALPLYTYYYKEVNSMGVMMLAGSDLLTVVTVLNHALTGLAMAAIVKYLDNIARVYAHSISMLITILISSLWLSRVPSIQFIFGSVIVLISLHLYHLPHDDYTHHHPHADDTDTEADADPDDENSLLPVKRDPAQ